VQVGLTQTETKRDWTDRPPY